MKYAFDSGTHSSSNKYTLDEGLKPQFDLERLSEALLVTVAAAIISFWAFSHHIYTPPNYAANKSGDKATAIFASSKQTDNNDETKSSDNKPASSSSPGSSKQNAVTTPASSVNNSAVNSPTLPVITPPGVTTDPLPDPTPDPVPVDPTDPVDTIIDTTTSIIDDTVQAITDPLL